MHNLEKALADLRNVGNQDGFSINDHNRKNKSKSVIDEEVINKHQQRISDLLLSDKLIHEENAKIIAELKEKNLKQENEI